MDGKWTDGRMNQRHLSVHGEDFSEAKCYRANARGPEIKVQYNIFFYFFMSLKMKN